MLGCRYQTIWSRLVDYVPDDYLVSLREETFDFDFLCFSSSLPSLVRRGLSSLPEAKGVVEIEVKGSPDQYKVKDVGPRTENERILFREQ